MSSAASKPIIPLRDFRAQYESIRTDVALAIAEVLERQDFVQGREVRELEKQMAALCGASAAVACANGSDALLLTLQAFGIGPGDEVLVPAFTFFATAGSVARLGARPVFTDIEPRTFNAAPGAWRKAIEKHPKIRAAIPVDLFGQVADMPALLGALPEGVAAIEDAAQAVLADLDGCRAGSFGRAAGFSFYPTKNLGAYGDAGIITTSDEELAERLRRLRDHGARERYYHDEVGMNSRLDTIQAAVLLVKLARLEAWTQARERAAANYTRLFRESGLACPDAVYPAPEHPVVTPFVAAGRRHVFHQYTIRVAERARLRRHLDAEGVRSAIFYPVPLHLQKCFAPLGGQPGDCPEAERAAEEVLSLPIFPEITGPQQERVVQAIAGFYSQL